MLVGGRSASAAPRDRAAAEVLFQAGRDALERGDWKAACARFEESNRLDPAAGTTMNLANCSEKLGRLAKAWELYRSALEALPADDDRVSVATERARALEKRIPYLTIRLAPGTAPATRVERDGIELGRASLGLALPVDPGRHLVKVISVGRSARSYTVELAEAERRELTVEAGELGAAGETRAPAPAPEGGAPMLDQSTKAAEQKTSHAGRFGAVLRGDIDGKGRGVVAAVGPTFGIHERLEVGASALIGRDKGVEAAVTMFVLTGPFKPRIVLGVPTFFVDGARVGLRGAVGLEWDPTPNMGAFVDVGASYFVNEPEGYDQTVFVPSLGVQARL
jgi:hypothetical protein